MAGNAARGRWTLSLTSEWIQRQRRKKAPAQSGRILKPPPKARGNGARLCAEHQPQRHGEATRFGIIRRLWASALAAAGHSDTAAVRWWFQDAAAIPGAAPSLLTARQIRFTVSILATRLRGRAPPGHWY